MALRRLTKVTPSLTNTDKKSDADFRYPFREGPPSSVSGKGNGASLGDFLDAQWRRIKNRRTAELHLRNGRDRLEAAELGCVFLCHNDRRMLPAFLDHYRKIGVDRFICVDDQSSDGSIDYLLSQADVDLWQSKRRYKEARRGKAWREWLMARYGFSRWYINVDSDEFLVPPMAGQMDLKHYIAELDRHSIRRVAAPMIDLYPERLDEAVFHGEGGQKPWEVAPLFDATGYETGLVRSGANLKGGVRRRVFQSRDHLMKYPLLYWDRSCSLGGSVHWPRPGRRNFTSEWGVLLHFKIFSDLSQRTDAVIANGQHMSGAANYKIIREKLAEEGGSIRLAYPGSARYETAEDLLRHGFLQSALMQNGSASR